MNTQAHWDRVYATKSVTEVSWYQREPLVSLDLIERVAPVRRAAILDVGSGASTLVDALLARGYTNLSVLDIAAAALDAARKRLGAHAGVVTPSLIPIRRCRRAIQLRSRWSPEH